MYNFSIDLKILPFVIYLSSTRILNNKLEKSGLLSKNELEKLIFLEQREYNYKLPNYIHINFQKYLLQEKKKISLLTSLREIFSYFITDRISLTVKQEKFEEWQMLTTLINPIHVIASEFIENNDKYSFFNSSSILHMNTNELINNFFKNNNFTDLHIHLNGTSEVIFSWQHFLNDPKLIYNQLKFNIHFEQLGFKNIKEIIDLIEVAKYIQENLIYIIKNKNYEDKVLIYDLKRYFNKINFFEKSNSMIHPIQIIYQDKCNENLKHNIPTYELIFLIEVFSIINNSKTLDKIRNIVNELTHLYLLIYSKFNRLLVQQHDQYGFDQFQMITDNGVRDFYEDLGYKDRFKQLKGVNSIRFYSIEGRYAPKKDIYKTYTLVNKAIVDYIHTSDSYYQKCREHKEKYKYISPKKSNQLNNKNKIKNLSLTAHFIKKKNINCVTNSKSSYLKLLNCPRHANLRKELTIQANILINMMKTHKGTYIELENIIEHNYLKFINGIDAAGNELYARPEVFAPTFKYIRKELKNKHINKYIGFTFHAGEDFVHIISGIRYIYEAVEFLEMQSKDRIGHATALGINPTTWKNKLNNMLLIKKGEWLDNLIFMSKLLNLNELSMIEIGSYWKDIYRTDFKGIDIAFEAYIQRKIDPDKVFLENSSYLNKNIIIENNEIKEIYKKYHLDYKTKIEYNKLITINISEYIDYIEPLQKRVLKILQENEIAIEVMLSSNTRISFYDRYEEHHIFNWFDKKNIPDLVIATDDPGIFNTNLQNEYLHIYNILSNKYEKSDEYILNIFKQLINNSKKYSFKR